MTPTTVQDAVLLVADVTASVELYERIGDDAAFARIAAALDRLRDTAERRGGEFVQSRGDDLLCLFPDGAAAAETALAMLCDGRDAAVQLHVGMHRGESILARNSIFGDAVNVAYRLASIANAGEALATGAAAETLPPELRDALRPLRSFRFKGREASVDVYVLEPPGEAPTTRLPDHFQVPPPAAGVVLRLEHDGRCWDVAEAESLALGRAEGSDLLLPRPWVSRRHATLLVRDGVALLTDRSTFGSYLTPDGGHEMHVRRQSMPLSGCGLLSPGASVGAPEAEIVRYAVLPADAPAEAASRAV